MVALASGGRTFDGVREMTLEDVVRDIESVDEKTTICARKPWTAGSEAQLVETVDGRLPTSIKEQGSVYFLEVYVARDILSQYVDVAQRTLEEKVKFLIYYAENDAFPDES